MKLFYFFFLALFSNIVTAQQMEYRYENANNRLRLIIVDEKRFDLDYRYKRFEAGVVDWEQGSAKVGKNRIVLKSDNPEKSTSLNKIILKRSKLNDGKSSYFTDDDMKLWKVCRVKNKKFESLLLSTEKTDLLNNQEFPE